jgi:hypothetical protein
MNGWWAWACVAGPAAEDGDITQLKKHVRSLKAHLCLEKWEAMVADGVWSVSPPPSKTCQVYSVFKGKNFITPHRKPKGQELSDDKKAENRELKGARGIVPLYLAINRLTGAQEGIENHFGELKKMCLILSNFRAQHTEERFTTIFHTCLALHNIHRFWAEDLFQQLPEAVSLDGVPEEFCLWGEPEPEDEASEGDAAEGTARAPSLSA